MDEIAKRKIGEKVSLVGTALEETIHLLEVHRAKGTPDVEPLLEKAKAALLNMEAVNAALAKLNAKKGRTRIGIRLKKPRCLPGHGVHDRMPVMLLPEDYDAWLGSTTAPEDLRNLLQPYDESLMEAYAVSLKVNS